MSYGQKVHESTGVNFDARLGVDTSTLGKVARLRPGIETVVDP